MDLIYRLIIAGVLGFWMISGLMEKHLKYLIEKELRFEEFIKNKYFSVDAINKRQGYIDIKEV